MRLAIRTRLTIWYTGVFVALLGVYSAAVFSFQYLELRDQLYRDEVREIEAVEGLLAWAPDGTLRLRDEYYSHPQSRLLVDRLMEIHDPGGKLLYSSNTLRGNRMGPPLYPGEGVAWFTRYSARLADGRSVLLASHAHPLDGRMVLIRLGYDLAPVRQRLLRFVYLLLLALPPAVLLAALAGHRLAHKAFAPLKELTEQAEGITVQDLGLRVQVPEPHGDELGRMALVLNGLLARLEASFAQLQQFTGDIAHELRTPLAALRLSGQEALMSGTPGDHWAVIGTMLEESERLIETVNGLLLLARAESPLSDRELSQFSLPELVGQIVEVLDVLLEERSLTVHEEGRAAAKDVLADRTLTHTALMNMLHNAIRYAPEGSAITVRYSRAAQRGKPMQQVCIEDTGPGVRAGEHERIFERFFRGTHQKPGSGAGLGLSIAKMAMEHSGGVIFADPSYIGGLRCCAALPLAE